MVDIFDEVDEDLRAERARKLFRRYGWLLAVAAVLVVGGASAWQMLQARRTARDEAAADQFLAAMKLADPVRPGADGTARAQAVGAFDDAAKTAPDGYRTLADLRAAALLAEGGDATKAAALWQAIADDEEADKKLRDLASLLLARQQIDAGDPATAEARLRSLTAPDGAWRGLAEESLALLHLRIGRADDAKHELQQLAADPFAAPNLRSRANGLLTRLGGEPDADAAAATPAE